jgi:hypothetical protein
LEGGVGGGRWDFMWALRLFTLLKTLKEKRRKPLVHRVVIGVQNYEKTGAAKSAIKGISSCSGTSAKVLYNNNFYKSRYHRSTNTTEMYMYYDIFSALKLRN